MPQYRNKFVKKIKYTETVSGRTLFRLIVISSGEEITPFASFLRERLRCENSPARSISAWSDDLASFFNYYIAASEFISANSDKITASPLSEIIFAFPNYLIEGRSSTNLIASKVARLTDFPTVKRDTALRRLSTLRTFLKSSAEHHLSLKSLHKLDLIDIDVSPKAFAEKLLKHKTINQSQRLALLQSSFLAGVIRGGPKYVSSTFFQLPQSTGLTNKSHHYEITEKSFPCNLLIELLSSADTYRDRALWALLAGTGIRTHEALNLLQSDIDGINETVLILPYEDRITMTTPRTAKEREAYKSKGRSTVETFFIEPFKTIFFENLHKYLRYERPICKHGYVFVALSNNARGRPLYLGDSTPHNKPFKKAQQKMGLSNIHTLHSLRHFYGTWLLNYIPTNRGYGLSLETVKIMMGHASSKMTERYAIKDKLIIRAQLEAFNSYFKKHGFDLEQVQIEAVGHYQAIASSGMEE